MDEQVTWKPHLKLLEILLIILSWPDCLPSACKIPPSDLGVRLHCSVDIQQQKGAETAPTEPLWAQDQGCWARCCVSLRLPEFTVWLHLHVRHSPASACSTAWHPPTHPKKAAHSHRADFTLLACQILLYSPHIASALLHLLKEPAQERVGFRKDSLKLSRWDKENMFIFKD